jgi:cytochrome P450
LDLFSAGAESVANSLDYSLLYLILNPDIQKKVQAELDAVVGRSRRPSLDDRPRYKHKNWKVEIKYMTLYNVSGYEK